MKGCATLKLLNAHTCGYDIPALHVAMFERGLNVKNLAKIIKARFGKAAPLEREIYYIFAGERKRPNPEFIKQIAEVLGVDLKSIIKAA